MKKIGKILLNGLVIGLVSIMVFCTASIVKAAPRFEDGPPGGSTQSQTVYDYPPEWGEIYAVFYSQVWVYPTRLDIVNEKLTTNLVLGSLYYDHNGRTHSCHYSGMAPNWTQINRVISASY